MILVTGSLAFDHIMNFPGRFGDHILPEKLHILNVSFLVPEMRKSFGGTSGNISYTLALFGVDVAILGVVGSDFAPYKKFLEENGVKTTYIFESHGHFTSTAFGITDRENNNIWGFYTGADDVSDSLSLGQVKESIEFGIVAPQKPETMLSMIRQYKRKAIPYIFDPGMQLPWFTKDHLIEAFEHASVVIGNDYEMSVIEKKIGIEMLSDFCKKGKIIITTLGGKGSRIEKKGKVFDIPPVRVESRDPAGAGDAYRAGFIAGFLKGMSLDVCGRMGSVAAAYTVEKFGTTTHMFTKKEFERRYKEAYKENLSI